MGDLWECRLAGPVSRLAPASAGKTHVLQRLRLMCDRSSNRSWSNMLRLGATVTMEAWDHYIHQGMDLVHPFAASPAHLIPRKCSGSNLFFPR
ncbi:MAG: hypothetical protein J6331_04625 [Lentisphaeria bacterium]|nr:hypothetical protein [Lentisphaeria bacterium]